MKILIVEDSEAILSMLKRAFKEQGYTVECADEGEEGEYLASLNSYDVIILDWMLPNMSGIQIVESLRKKGIKTPIIMLTAKSDIDDRVLGLQKGADDYLPKPFSFKELKARVEALYRRTLSSGANIVNIADICIDIDSKTVKKGDETVEMTLKEYELLLFLIRHKNLIVSNDMIKDQLWSEEEYINSNVIAVTIYHIRKKLGKELIKSFRGMGYKIGL